MNSKFKNLIIKIEVNGKVTTNCLNTLVDGVYIATLSVKSFDEVKDQILGAIAVMKTLQAEATISEVILPDHDFADSFYGSEIIGGVISDVPMDARSQFFRCTTYNKKEGKSRTWTHNHLTSVTGYK